MGKIKWIVLTVTFMILAAQTAWAGNWNRGKTITVSITNITRGQVFSPPVVISHNRNFRLFKLGAPAGEGLSLLAEDGHTDPLISEVEVHHSVYDYAVSPGFVPPGETITLEISVKGRYRFISIAGMMVSTNDAFFAVQSMPVHFHQAKSAMARAYDAGSEANSEACTDIPGPPCGSGGVRNTNGAEGYVHVHNGIHGKADLDPAQADWRNPVARITVSSGN